MTEWTEADRGWLNGTLQSRSGRKMLAFLRENLPVIVATNSDHYALLAAEKEGMMKILKTIEVEMTVQLPSAGLFAQHADMSKD